MSESTSNVFVETVDGVGQFTFRRRTMRLEFATQAERARLSEGAPVTPYMAMFIEAFADLKVMLVDPPDGWGPEALDELDPFDDAVYGRVLKVWSALRGKEETFRKARTQVPGSGAG
jgi:hypothetical protein